MKLDDFNKSNTKSIVCDAYKYLECRTNREKLPRMKNVSNYSFVSDDWNISPQKLHILIIKLILKWIHNFLITKCISMVVCLSKNISMLLVVNKNLKDHFSTNKVGQWKVTFLFLIPR